MHSVRRLLCSLHYLYTAIPASRRPGAAFWSTLPVCVSTLHMKTARWALTLPLCLRQSTMMLFFGCLGACNLVLFAPLVSVLAWDSLRQLHGNVLLILVTKGSAPTHCSRGRYLVLYTYGSAVFAVLRRAL